MFLAGDLAGLRAGSEGWPTWLSLPLDIVANYDARAKSTSWSVTRSAQRSRANRGCERAQRHL